MPRTDREIAEYMKYYAGRGNKELQWALENLAKVEGKTPAEIREICEREATKKPKAEKKPRNEGGRPMIPRDAIRAELLAGGTLCSVAEKLDISSATVGRVRLEMVKEGLLKAGRPYPGRKKDRQPEAYPGQISDDEPEIEDDVKAYVPGEIKREPPTASECKKPEVIDEPPAVRISNAFQNLADSLHTALFGEPPDDEPEEEEIEEEKEPEQPETPWKALSDQMCDFAVGTFGKGTRITAMFWDEDERIANVSLKTADERLIRITMEVGK